MGERLLWYNVEEENQGSCVCVQNAENSKNENSKNENLPCCWSGAHDWRMQHEIPEMKDESVQMHFTSRPQLAGMEFVAHDFYLRSSVRCINHSAQKKQLCSIVNT
jgi:hypothetical protein